MDTVERLAEAAGVRMRADGVRDWSVIEQSLGGLRLPDDYKRIVDGFPHGHFLDLISVIRPDLHDGSESEFLGYYEHQLEDLREWRADGDGVYPYPIFPEVGGILPWAASRTGEMFFWLTEDDDPDKWPLVLTDKRCEQWRLLDLRMSEFLLDFITEPPAEFAESLARSRVSGLPFLAFEAPVPPDPAKMMRRAESALRRLTAPAPVQESDELIAAMPDVRGTAGSIDWAEWQRSWGFAFPDDYRHFYDRVGPGLLCDIAIFGPEAPGGLDTARLVAAAREQAAGSEIFRFHPDPDGIVPWGLSTDGWIFGWQNTTAEPVYWTVTVVNPSLDQITFPTLTFSTFLREYTGLREPRQMLLFGRKEWNGPVTFRSAVPG